MPKTDLKGKTVMIAAYNKFFPKNETDMIEAMKRMGATVVYSEHSPHHPKNGSLMIEEIKGHNPKIDAFMTFLHSSLPSSLPMLENETAAAFEVTKHLKEAIPVIVCDRDSGRCMTDIQAFQDAGAKYLNSWDMKPEQIAFEVADAIAQHGKPGRKAAV